MNTLSGISFYDAINKVSIGAIILVAVKPCASFMNDALCGMLFLIASFVVGIIVQTGIESFTSPLRNNPCMLRKAYKKVHDGADICDKDPQEAYNKAYYNVVRRNVLLNVPTLEAIERFIRSFVIVMFFVVLLCGENKQIEAFFPSINLYWKCYFMFFIWLPLIISWFPIQYKIYELIWEADKYIKE